MPGKYSSPILSCRHACPDPDPFLDQDWYEAVLFSNISVSVSKDQNEERARGVI